MIAPHPITRSASAPLFSGSGRPSAHNKDSLAGNLSRVSSVNSQPLPVPDTGGVDSRSIISFSQNSASGKPLSDVNTAKHIASFLKDLKGNEPGINELESFGHVMELCGVCDIETNTLSLGTQSALALFSLLPADKKDAGLMATAKTFHDTITKEPSSALQAMKDFTKAILEKMELSQKAANAGDNLKQFCSNYLQEYVYPDIIAKLDGKLSADYVQMLRENPANVENHLFAGENDRTDRMIAELQKEFLGFKGMGDKAVVLESLFKELEHKTQIMAGLIKQNTAAPGAPASPPAGLAADHDIGQPGPADGGNAGSVAPNINYITNNYNITYNTLSPTTNHVSTTNINLSDHAEPTKPADDKSQSTAANQATAGSTTEPFDEVDNIPASPLTDNLKHVTSANISAADKSLNSAGTLYGTKGPAPSWLGNDSAVTLTRGGQVRDLSQKQAYEQGGEQQKQPTSLNTFGNQFVGFGKQNPGPAPLGGAGKIQQDAPQASGAQSTSTVKDIPVSDNALNSDSTPQDADGIYHAVPAKAETDTSLNSAGTLYGTKGPAPSWLDNDSAVTLTRDAQVRDLSQKQAYRQDGVQQKQPTSVNAQGTLFAGMGKSGTAPTPSRRTDETQQASQDAAQVSYKADLLIPGKKPNFITTLDIQVNSDGTLQQTTDDIYHATPAKVVAERQVNAQGTSFGMKAGAASASTQSETANNNSAVILTQQGAQTRELSKQLAYRLGGSQQKGASSVNSQGNQFVGVGKNSPIPELTQSWINNKGDNVVLTQEGAQTRALTEKDQYRAGKITNSRSPNIQPTNSPEAE